MPAQLGRAVQLGYGPQGARQLGRSVLLSYTPVAVPQMRLSTGLRAPWRAPVASTTTTHAPHVATAKLGTAKRHAWGTGTALSTARRPVWGVAASVDRERRAPWGRYERRPVREVLSAWVPSRPVDRGERAPWGRYERYPVHEVVAPWVRSIARDRESLLPWAAVGPQIVKRLLASMPPATARDSTSKLPWTRYSRTLSPGWGVVQPPGPTPGPGGTWIVPIKQVYLMLNEVTLTRVSDGAVVPCTAMQLGLTSDAWTWQFSARVPMAALALVPRGEELQAVVNGEPVRVLVESLARERVFGADWLRVSGRGKAAALAAPISPVLTFGNTSARTAQQLMADVLTVNSVPLGWDIDWQITDWLVPAGAWSMQGSYIDALTAIASAAGAYLQPHPTDDVLRVSHRYPVAPWDWAGMTPDYELPSAVTTRENIEWVEKPAYNRVFVAGQVGGILAQVTRTGTAGDVLAPMVTDALITHADAGSQRGRAILGDTGAQASVTLRLPVLEETGLIVPGKTVRYVDGSVVRIGITRGTAVDVGPLETWQTLTVETRE